MRAIGQDRILDQLNQAIILDDLTVVAIIHGGVCSTVHGITPAPCPHFAHDRAAVIAADAPAHNRHTKQAYLPRFNVEIALQADRARIHDETVVVATSSAQTDEIGDAVKQDNAQNNRADNRFQRGPAIWISICCIHLTIGWSNGKRRFILW